MFPPIWPVDLNLIYTILIHDIISLCNSEVTKLNGHCSRSNIDTFLGLCKSDPSAKASRSNPLAEERVIVWAYHEFYINPNNWWGRTGHSRGGWRTCTVKVVKYAYLWWTRATACLSADTTSVIGVRDHSILSLIPILTLTAMAVPRLRKMINGITGAIEGIAMELLRR